MISNFHKRLLIGILPPVSQQGSGSFGENTRFTNDSATEERLQAFKTMEVGDLICVDGEPYVIHDVSV